MGNIVLLLAVIFSILKDEFVLLGVSHSDE